MDTRPIDYNSLDLSNEKVIMYILMGCRRPQNKFEKKLMKQILDIEKKGSAVGIPFIG